MPATPGRAHRRSSGPALLVCGDEDRYFPKEVYEETARLIPDCTLRMYEGVGHTGVLRDGRIPRDVLEFVRQQQALQREGGTEQQTIADGATAAAETLGNTAPRRGRARS